mmetsp:Transcript_58450/g.174103  ORF Transcript_58450/g.174103 Transcript_58450/m.174103 type:complete len:106 (+) Transcript_58450:411-728(+)
MEKAVRDLLSEIRAGERCDHPARGGGGGARIDVIFLAIVIAVMHSMKLSARKCAVSFHVPSRSIEWGWVWRGWYWSGRSLACNPGSRLSRTISSSPALLSSGEDK